MNKQTTTSVARVLVPILLLAFVACKKETVTPDPGPPAKTLNKTIIFPKIWYTSGSSIIHDLRAGGVYGSMGGTWAWKNSTSDTMKIIAKTGIPEIEWKIYWNNEHEMEAESLATHVKLLYKDQAW